MNEELRKVYKEYTKQSKSVIILCLNGAHANSLLRTFSDQHPSVKVDPLRMRIQYSKAHIWFKHIGEDLSQFRGRFEKLILSSEIDVEKLTDAQRSRLKDIRFPK